MKGLIDEIGTGGGMFDFSFGGLIASMLVSGAGFVYFKYGRRRGRSIHVTVGLIMMIYPYFIYDMKWLLGIAAGLCAVDYWMIKSGF